MKKKFNFLSSNAKKIMLAVLISMIWITTLTPVVFAATIASIKVDFDPNGAIDIAVSPKTKNFGTVLAGAWSNSSASEFSIFNNGTMPMDAQFKTNATSSGGMVLGTTATPGADQYSLHVDSLNVTNTYITTSYVELATFIEPNAHRHFELCLKMGSSITSNWSAQTTTVYLQGHTTT
jgi:hypothetical protein